MAQIPAKCRRCGHQFISRMFNFPNGTDISFSGIVEMCPMPGCGGDADLQSGSYDFVDGVIAAFRAPGMTREKIEAFAGVVAQAADGKITPERAVGDAQNISALLGALLAAARDHGVTFDRLLAVIGIILSGWALYSSDADARANLGNVQARLSAERTQIEVQRKLLSELEELNASVRDLASISVSPPQGPKQTTPTKNRHERRKDAALSRRQSKP